MQNVTLVYAFLLSLLEEELKEQAEIYRKVKRYIEASIPLYHILLALDNMLNESVPTLV